MTTPIPYGRQDITDADVDAVVRVLRSDFLTQGPVVQHFEKEVAKYCGAQRAVAVNSATSALHLACLALGVGPGDLVWTTAVTFVASANCARYCGADVDFVDIDSQTCNISVSRLTEKLEAAEAKGRLPKVVIPVHLCGQSCEMEAIHGLSKRFGFRIIEDASHALGGRYMDEPIGGCRFSDITVFSFHPVKMITTGEGGMALTNDPALANHMARLRSHGITRDAQEMTDPPDGPWYYQQIELGFNYRMPDILAALGASQLLRLDDYVARRHERADRYDQLIKDLPVRAIAQLPDSYSSYHLYVVRVQTGAFNATHREVFERLRSAGVSVNLHYIPLYRQPYFKRLGISAADFPEAERYYSEAITLPLFPGLTEVQQGEVVESMKTPVGHQTLF
jgi:UDP-4-amino-4,6-dideoxy-N-acetyl-beta-L-altrosamine transaminase